MNRGRQRGQVHARLVERLDVRLNPVEQRQIRNQSGLADPEDSAEKITTTKTSA